MNIESLREYCLNKPLAEETLPFDDDVLVFKVGGKAFALASIAAGNRVNLKCDPEKAIILREDYLSIDPGVHMNKKHWNTIHFNGDADDNLIRSLIDHSYSLVVISLSKKLKKELFNN
ncbi:MAG: hypothetical protein RIQ89_1933 [Bacteroidota bacterium]|jgi:predicted DNA-binding protein (MmcQ/YjbR family)